MAVYLPRLSPGWATLLLNVVALTYSTNAVFVKSIETAEPKPLPSLACAVRFLIATTALAILSQVFTSKPCTENNTLRTTKHGNEEVDEVPLSEVPLAYVGSNRVELGTPRNRRGARNPLSKGGEESDALFEISLDSTKGSVRSTPRLSPFGCGPGGWHHDSATPTGAAPYSETKGLEEKWSYPDDLQKAPDGSEEKLLGAEVVETEAVSRRLSPVVASLELGVLMFLGFAAQAIALETAMAGHVALLFTISVSAAMARGGTHWWAFQVERCHTANCIPAALESATKDHRVKQRCEVLILGHGKFLIGFQLSAKSVSSSAVIQIRSLR